MPKAKIIKDKSIQKVDKIIVKDKQTKKFHDDSESDITDEYKNTKIKIYIDKDEDSDEDLDEESEDNKDEESDDNKDEDSEDNKDEEVDNNKNNKKSGLTLKKKEDNTTNETNIKDKIKKLSFNELTAEIINLNNEKQTNKTKILELEKQINILKKEENNLDKIINKYIYSLDKKYEDNLKIESKKKKVRNTNSNSGICKESIVPTVFCKFLGLPDNTLHTRTNLVKLFHQKCTELELKKGNIITFDKKTASLFNVETNYTIGIFTKSGDDATNCQTFIAKYYRDFEKKNNSVVL
jgi:hypothetical protein